MSKECAQYLDDHPTPCFQALGECNLSHCPVITLLKEKGCNPKKLSFAGRIHLRHALHWVCPQSIHNEDLTDTQRAKLYEGLRRSANK